MLSEKKAKELKSNIKIIIAIFGLSIAFVLFITLMFFIVVN